MNGKQQQVWEHAEFWARGNNKKAQLTFGNDWQEFNRSYQIHVSGPNGSGYLPSNFTGDIDVFLCEKTQNELQKSLDDVVKKLAAYKKAGGSCE